MSDMEQSFVAKRICKQFWCNECNSVHRKGELLFTQHFAFALRDRDMSHLICALCNNRKSAKAKLCQNCYTLERIARNNSNGLGASNPNKVCPLCNGVKDLHSRLCNNCRITSMQTTTICPICNKPKKRRAKLCHDCRVKSYNNKRLDKDGYVLVRNPIDNQVIYEHRLVWEQAHGTLPDGWVVHHLNSVHNDNRLENLFAMSRKSHLQRDWFKALQRRIISLEAEVAMLKQLPLFTLDKTAEVNNERSTINR